MSDLGATQERLAAIRAREQAATPGPLAAVPASEGNWWYVQPQWFVGVREPQKPWISVEVASITDGGRNNSKQDAVFFANARTDIPFLLAEVDRLTAEVERLRAACSAALLARDWQEILEIADPLLRQAMGLGGNANG